MTAAWYDYSFSSPGVPAHSTEATVFLRCPGSTCQGLALTGRCVHTRAGGLRDTAPATARVCPWSTLPVSVGRLFSNDWPYDVVLLDRVAPGGTSRQIDAAGLAALIGR